MRHMHTHTWTNSIVESKSATCTTIPKLLSIQLQLCHVQNQQLLFTQLTKLFFYTKRHFLQQKQSPPTYPDMYRLLTPGPQKTVPSFETLAKKNRNQVLPTYHNRDNDVSISERAPSLEGQTKSLLSNRLKTE